MRTKGISRANVPETLRRGKKAGQLGNLDLGGYKSWARLKICTDCHLFHLTSRPFDIATYHGRMDDS